MPTFNNLENLASVRTKINNAISAIDDIPPKLKNLAYVDFTTKVDGLPPSNTDTGQTSSYIFTNTGRKPAISNGRLVIDPRPASGGLADYYQVDIQNSAVRLGMEWTQPSGSDSGDAAAVLFAWAAIYGGGTVPKSWCHIVIIPGTGATGTAQWWVGDGTVGGLINVKSQSFVNPPADGSFRWRVDAVLDLPSGQAFARLPDGSIMSLTDAEIAAFCVLISKTPFTFANIGSCPIIGCEHFTVANASIAKFAEFTALWAESFETAEQPWTSKASTLLDDLRTSAYLASLIPPLPVGKTHSPTTQLSITATTSAANVDATNAIVSCRAGPSGIINYSITGYYEYSAADRVFWRLVLNGGIGVTPPRVVSVGTTSDTVPAVYMESVTGLVPGTLYSATLQHFSVTGGRATLKAGGTFGAMTPALTFLAVPA